MEVLLGFLATHELVLGKVAVAGLVLCCLWGLVDGYRHEWGASEVIYGSLMRGIVYPCAAGFGVAMLAGIIFGIAWVVG